MYQLSREAAAQRLRAARIRLAPRAMTCLRAAAWIRSAGGSADRP